MSVPMWVWEAVLAAAAYLLGSVPFGLILCRLIKGVDIREQGSRNIGATNAGRVCGWPFFAITFVLDFLKGLAPVLVGLVLVSGGEALTTVGQLMLIGFGACAILGHTFPVYLRFKGGKAVATSFGVFVGLAPVAAGVAFAIWLVVFVAARYVSLASIVAAVCAPAVYLVEWRGEISSRVPVLVFLGVVATLVVVRHRGNMARLMNGTESRIKFGKKKAE